VVEIVERAPAVAGPSKPRAAKKIDSKEGSRSFGKGKSSLRIDEEEDDVEWEFLEWELRLMRAKIAHLEQVERVIHKQLKEL